MRTRAQIILLAAERDWTTSAISEVVRHDENTVRLWLKRYVAEGIEGLRDAPHPGARPKVTEAYTTTLVATVRRRPRSMGLPFSTWTLQRLADYLAEQTGIRVGSETVRSHLAKHDIVLSRPQHKISSPDPDYRVKKRRLKPPAPV
ncbi:MAG: helix-turn-helix domain-containing protein [Anaerolineae bacterium]|nr:helix-turn-helix domain-containing protein [Anaerolineae bacterium]